MRYPFSPLSGKHSFVIHLKIISGDNNIDFLGLIMIIKDNMANNRHPINGAGCVVVVIKNAKKFWDFPKQNLLRSLGA